MKLAISLASRGRPAQLIETVKRSVVNWTHPNTEMHIQLDADDEQSIYAVERAGFPGGVRVNVREREDTIAAKWNRILAVDADVYSVAADDDPYVTPGYDSAILQAAERFPDGIGMVYGHLANLSFSGSISGTRRWCEILGYLQPEHFPYWFCDHWTDDLARMTGRISFADIKTDQTRAGKTQELREPAWWATFYDVMFLERHRESKNIYAGMKAWVNAETCLISTWPLIDQRSRGINESVRQQARELQGWSGLTDAPERYKRVKARAVEMARKALDDPDMPAWMRDWAEPKLFPPTTVPNLLG